jgi:hypothetical protein
MLGRVSLKRKIYFVLAQCQVLRHAQVFDVRSVGDHLWNIPRVFGGGVYQANARFPLTCQGERDTSRPFRLLLPLSMSSSLLGDFWCDPLSSIVTGYPNTRAARLVLELCGSEGKQSAVSAVHTVGGALLGVGPNTLAGLCMGWG